MYKNIHFDTVVNIDNEIAVTVDATYTPGYAGCWYRKNGDPGDPPEPAECDIDSVIGPNGVDIVEKLPELIIEQLREEAMNELEKQNYNYLED